MKVEVYKYHDSKKLEIIIPFRWTDKRSDLFERIRFSHLDSDFPFNTIGITISDDGSPIEVKNELRKICQENGMNYVYTNSEYSPVCMSRARNNAVVNISSDLIFFQDADLIPYKGFYRDVMSEINSQNIVNDSANFLMFGVVYLTKDATQEFFKTPDEYRKNLFLNYFLEDDTRKIEKFSTGTSVTVFNRHYYLSRGGYDEDFIEWGYEDLEFNLRCIRALKKFPLPENFSKDIGTFKSIDRYEGWKSLYRLFGDLTFNKGMLMFHAWHEIDNDSTYMKKKALNSELFLKKIKAFASVGDEPAPLPMMERGRTLCFSATNPFIFNRRTVPFFGELIIENENNLTEFNIGFYIDEQKIDRVLFHNPYANEHRLSLFKAVKAANIPFLIAERGALRNSVFFDDTGFNADSTRYRYEYWKNELSLEERQNVKNYVLDEKSRDDSLENQPPRIGAIALRKKLSIPKSKKVIFVPLQRPSDTVIKFFTKKLGGYEEFLKIIEKAAKSLHRDYVFVLKRHPLEVETPKIDGVVYADNSNVKDLLELCSKVFLINSGVGVLALIYNKHVIAAGDAFYSCPELVSKASSVSEFIKCIDSEDPSSENEKMKFINYLISKFYSFGSFETRTIPWHEGGMMTITSKIDFYQINIPGFETAKYIWERPFFKNSSIIFDRYKKSASQVKTTSSVVAKPATSNVVDKNKSISNFDVVVQKNNILNNFSDNNELNPVVNKSFFRKRIKKFKNNPRKFYQDSKNPLIRNLGVLLGYRNN